MIWAHLLSNGCCRMTSFPWSLRSASGSEEHKQTLIGRLHIGKLPGRHAIAESPYSTSAEHMGHWPTRISGNSGPDSLHYRCLSFSKMGVRHRQHPSRRCTSSALSFSEWAGRAPNELCTHTSCIIHRCSRACIAHDGSCHSMHITQSFRSTWSTRSGAHACTCTRLRWTSLMSLSSASAPQCELYRWFTHHHIQLLVIVLPEVE